MTKLTKNQGQNLKSLFSPLRTAAATACLLSLAAPSATAGGLTKGSTFMLFLECNNDGLFHIVENSPVVNGWEYTIDAAGDNTDGDAYDMGGIAMKQIGDEVYVAITGGTPLDGEGYDRSIDKIFHGDLLFTPAGVNFQDAMETGQLSGVHFSGSDDSGADNGLGLYKNVSAKGVGAQNFGHSSQQNYANIVNPDVDNFFGDLGYENDYFDTSKGYNVIAEGTKVENDGFELLELPDLENLGLDLAQFGDSPNPHTFGFKFNIDALFPPRTPIGIGPLLGIADEADVPIDPTWEPEIASIDQNISDLQNEADRQQDIADDWQQEAEKQQETRDRAEAEREKMKGLRDTQGGVNHRIAIANPGSSGFLQGNGVHNNLKNANKDLNKAQKVIDNNPAKIATAEQERDAAQTALDAIPSEEDYLSDKIENADQGMKDLYDAVEDLTAQKEAWEEYKPDDWDSLTLEEKKVVQEGFGGEWVAIRQDGSASKQEQELETFIQAIENFENDALAKRQQAIDEYDDIIENRNSKIAKYERQIAKSENDKETAEQRIATIETEGKDKLLSDLEELKQNARDGLNNLDGLNPAQKEERTKFYNAEIVELQEQIDRINNSDSFSDAVNYFSYDRDGYYWQELYHATRADDRLILDENGEPERYTLEDLQIEVPVYDSEANQIGTEIIDVASRDLIGQPKTVGDEYTIGGRIWGKYNKIGQDNTEGGLKKISKDAKKAKNNALKENQAALDAKDDALEQKEEQIEAKNDRLLEIEDAIVAEQTKKIMAQRLEATKEAEALEKALDEKYGVRTENNLIPTTPEEVEEFNRVPEVPQNEDENRVSAPEPSGIAGLLAVGLALMGGKLRKKNQ